MIALELQQKNEHFCFVVDKVMVVVHFSET